MIEVLPMQQFLAPLFAFVSEHSTNQLYNFGVCPPAPHIEVVGNSGALRKIAHELPNFAERTRLKFTTAYMVPCHFEDVTYECKLAYTGNQIVWMKPQVRTTTRAYRVPQDSFPTQLRYRRRNDEPRTRTPVDESSSRHSLPISETLGFCVDIELFKK
jgi:hypothetical protein